MHKKWLCLLCCLILLTACGSSHTSEPAIPASAQETAAVFGAETPSAAEPADPPPAAEAPATPRPEPTLAPLPDPTEAPVTEAPVTEAPAITPPAQEPAPGETPAPEPSPTPEAVPAPAALDLGPLQSRLEAAIASWGGDWSVYLKDLNSGQELSINEGPKVAASLIKLYVYGTVWEYIEAGDMRYEDWSYDLYTMISVSSNEACNRLIDALGGFYPVNDFIARHGYNDSELNRKMLSGEPVENYTSTRDCGRLLEEVLQGTYVSADCSANLLDALAHQEWTERIPAGVPAGVATANKTGELISVGNDVAIVYAPNGTYILCLMASQLGSGYIQEASVELSGIVYSYLNPQDYS